jgi:hypothetical protein
MLKMKREIHACLINVHDSSICILPERAVKIGRPVGYPINE